MGVWSVDILCGDDALEVRARGVCALCSVAMRLSRLGPAEPSPPAPQADVARVLFYSFTGACSSRAACRRTAFPHGEDGNRCPCAQIMARCSSWSSTTLVRVVLQFHVMLTACLRDLHASHDFVAARADECQKLLELVDEIGEEINVRQAFERKFMDILAVANERLNLKDTSDCHRPAGNSLSIMALLLMSVGCRFPHGFKSCVLSGIKQDVFSRHYVPRHKLMSEFAEIVSEYNTRGGECVQWPTSAMSEAVMNIKAAAAFLPKKDWDDSTLLHTPVVPSSRVNRKPAQKGAVAPYQFHNDETCPVERILVVHGPPFHVAVEVLCWNVQAKELFFLRAAGGDGPPVHVLTEDAETQAILESERTVDKNVSPFAAPHLKIGSRVLLQGLKGSTQYNGQHGTVLGDSQNGRIVVDLDLTGKNLLVKRSNLTLIFSEQVKAMWPEFGKKGTLMSDGQEDQAGSGVESCSSPSTVLPKKPKPINAAQVAAQKQEERNRQKEVQMTAEKQRVSGAPSEQKKQEQHVESVSRINQDSTCKVGDMAAAGVSGRQDHAMEREKPDDSNQSPSETLKQKVVDLEPVRQTSQAKENLREKVGVCLRSQEEICVGDDYLMLSCSARCGTLLLQYSAMLEICPSASRRLNKMLGIKCPRSACPGKVEGLKGFKDSVAIREGNFEKGAKGSVGLSDEASAAKTREEHLPENEDSDSEEEAASGKRKIVIGKDGKEIRRDPHHVSTLRKDHGFIKKVMDRKKKDHKNEDSNAVADNADEEEVDAEQRTQKLFFRAGAMLGLSVKEVQDLNLPKKAKMWDNAEIENFVRKKIKERRKESRRESGGDAEQPGAANQRIEVIKPQKAAKNEGEVEVFEPQEEISQDSEAAGCFNSGLVPLKRDDSDDDDILVHAGGGADGDISLQVDRVRGKKKKQTKQVFSLQDFHATSSAKLTPGLTPEEQALLARAEQERQDEMMARDMARLDSYEGADTDFYNPYSQKPNKSTRSPKLCQEWQQTGHCSYGAECRYTHGEASDERSANVDAQRLEALRRVSLLSTRDQHIAARCNEVSQAERERIAREGQQQYLAHLMYQQEKREQECKEAQRKVEEEQRRRAQEEKQNSVQEAQRKIEQRQRAEASEARGRGPVQNQYACEAAPQVVQQDVSALHEGGIPTDDLPYREKMGFGSSSWLHRQEESAPEKEKVGRMSEQDSVSALDDGRIGSASWIRRQEASASEKKQADERQAEEWRQHAERQEAERMFMRKFLGGGPLSELAPEFAPMR